MDNSADNASSRAFNGRQTLRDYSIIQPLPYSKHESLRNETEKLNRSSHPPSSQPRFATFGTRFSNSEIPLSTYPSNQSARVRTEEWLSNASNTHHVGEGTSPYHCQSPNYPRYRQPRPIDFVYHDFAELAALAQPQSSRLYDAHSITSRSARSDCITRTTPGTYRHDPLVSRVVSVGGQYQYRRPSQNETASLARRNPSSNWNSSRSTVSHRQQTLSSFSRHALDDVDSTPLTAHDSPVYRARASVSQQNSASRFLARPSSEHVRGHDLLEERRMRLKGTSHSLADRCLEPQIVSCKTPFGSYRTKNGNEPIFGEQQGERCTRQTYPLETSARCQTNNKIEGNILGKDNEDGGRHERSRIHTHRGLDWDSKPPSTTTITGPYSARKRRRPADQNECNLKEIEGKLKKSKTVAAQFSSNTQTQQIKSQHLPNRFSRALYTNQIFLNQPIGSSPSTPFGNLAHSALHSTPAPTIPVGNNRHQFSRFVDESSPIHRASSGAYRGTNAYGSNNLKYGSVPNRDSDNSGTPRHPHSHTHRNTVAMRRRRSSSSVANGDSIAHLAYPRDTDTPPPRHDDAFTWVHSNSIGNPQRRALSVSSGDISLHSDGAIIDNDIENGHLDHVSACDSDGASAVAATLSAASSDPSGPLSRKEVRLLRLVNSFDQHSRTTNQPPKVIRDPDVQFPGLSKDFSGIPPSAIGDLLQVWDFATTFAGPLRLSSFRLLHLEQAVTHPDSSSILESLLVCLVRAFVTDDVLISELTIPNSVINPLHSKGFTLQSVMQALPNILSYETDEVDANDLQDAVQQLRSGRMAFFKSIGPPGRLRILRELVDYASMSDVIRECITDTMEFLDEERKKAREDFTANRKQIENTIKELRNELQEYKQKHGLVHQDNVNEREKGNSQSPGENTDGRGEAASSSSKSGPLSRQEKLHIAQKQRREEEERREKERGLEAIITRIEKARLSLRALKNSRGRGRAKEMDNNEPTLGTRSSSQIESQGDAVRTVALGRDRLDRCYWFFEGCGRIWIENTEQNEWAVLKSMDSIRQLLGWLSPDRVEEVVLKTNLTAKLEMVEKEIADEAELVQLADKWVKSNGTDTDYRFTRSGKRRSLGDEGNINKKNRTLSHFLEYRNDES